MVTRYGEKRGRYPCTSPHSTVLSISYFGEKHEPHLNILHILLQYFYGGGGGGSIKLDEGHVYAHECATFKLPVSRTFSLHWLSFWMPMVKISIDFQYH